MPSVHPASCFFFLSYLITHELQQCYHRYWFVCVMVISECNVPSDNPFSIFNPLYIHRYVRYIVILTFLVLSFCLQAL